MSAAFVPATATGIARRAGSPAAFLALLWALPWALPLVLPWALPLVLPRAPFFVGVVVFVVVLNGSLLNVLNERALLLAAGWLAACWWGLVALVPRARLLLESAGIPPAVFVLTVFGRDAEKSSGVFALLSAAEAVDPNVATVCLSCCFCPELAAVGIVLAAGVVFAFRAAFAKALFRTSASRPAALLLRPTGIVRLTWLVCGIPLLRAASTPAAVTSTINVTTTPIIACTYCTVRRTFCYRRRPQKPQAVYKGHACTATRPRLHCHQAALA